MVSIRENGVIIFTTNLLEGQDLKPLFQNSKTGRKIRRIDIGLHFSQSK